MPTDLQGKKELLKKKKQELRELTKSITLLETEIEALSPKSEKTKKLVTARPIEKSDFNSYIEIQATVQSDDLVNASSEVAGRIINLNTKEGAYVQKGQIIAKIDLEQIDKQEAELRKALELAVDVYERQSRLWKQNIGSEIQYLEAKNNKERIEKSLETIAFQKQKAFVYAPISGIIDQEFLKEGELATPGMPIVQILNTARVKVIADVPENYLKVVKKGANVSIKFPALEETTTARITQIGRVINPANRTFEVEASLANKKGLLKPNLLALMLLNDFSEKDVMTLPLDIIQQDISGKDYLFVKKEGEDGAYAQKVYVETGKSYNGQIIIKKGLKEGDLIIIDGARTLADNQLIQLEEIGTHGE